MVKPLTRAEIKEFGLSFRRLVNHDPVDGHELFVIMVLQGTSGSEICIAACECGNEKKARLYASREAAVTIRAR